jgi:hypothetical protein
MVHSISVSIGMMVGFLDLSLCMNRTKFGSYSSFSTAVLMSLEQRSIAERCVLDRSALDRNRAAIDRSHKTMLPQTEQCKKKKNEI